ncbi:MexE family multidrug efflux RND transporter periplasmic adaptor subunit [Camelimonas fluminis]|uniref:Efflux RND transporter periplasmic adaptor subunit n=1 Tax=Camelimonas fluminis TaxID=1576911 RepID=A0ABV7ULR4_9HYPH|nr:efflux RND transporter periplasmic adaptor subunit [Camelimonas fluminis]GHE56499.1 MexE family multidrug efflux RND transporter periplasmic adaptor subunit [Camelimonas fluminis]
MNSKRLPLLSLLTVFGAALTLAGCSDNSGGKAAAPPPPQVTAARPVVRQVVEHDDFTGRFEAVEAVEVRARVSGVLESVLFREGGMVKQGDLLFVIDRRPYQAVVDQALAAVKSAKARVDFAVGDLDRARNLSKTGNISEQILETRRQTAQVAQADVAAAEANLEAARLNLSFTEIRSPISGRIGRRELTEGNLVVANTTLLTNIVSVDPIYFYFDIDERSLLAYTRLLQAGGEKPGTEVMVALSDEDEPSLRGKLDFLSNRLDPGTGTLRARAVLPNPGGLLKAGMFGRIRVPGSAPYQGVLVPDVAIMTDQNRRFVWVVDEGGVARAQVVRPGPRIDGYRLVRSGLKGDETIVINGMVRVRPGVKLAAKVVELPPKAPPAGAAAAPAVAPPAKPDETKAGAKPPEAGQGGDGKRGDSKAPASKTPEKK